MALNKEIYVWQVKNGSKKPRKVKVSKLISIVNENLFSSQLFINEEKAMKYINKIK